jgi:imidazolonepropionase-like amidohydrolase
VRTRMKLSAWFAAAAVLSLPAAALAQSDVTYVQAGRLLADPATGQVLTGKTLVVQGGKVVEVRDGFVGQGHVVDLRDSFVLPGLIDSHVHLCHENGRDDKINRVTHTASDYVVDAVVFAGRTLQAGFTTVADLGDENDSIFALRDGIAAGKIAGPRIIAAGNVLSPHGGEGDVYGYRWDVTQAIERPNLCSGADDCRRIVRQQVQRGADIIKIVATGAVLSDADQGVGQQFTDEEMRAIVETAHMLGRQVTAHAHSAVGINAALRAGVDSIEHGTFLDAESIKLFKSRGAYYQPTLMAGDTVTGWARDPHTFLSPAARDKALIVGPQMISAARRAHEAGVKMSFGTDSSVSPHGKNAHEFSLLVKAGFTPLEAIQTATTKGADHLRLTRLIGTLAPGKQADMVAVRGDPLIDVSVMEQVSFVMKGGEVFRDDRH